MDLHLLTYFVAVVDHGGVTKAAESLYISQPSLSQAIRTLERRLGTTLFDRTGRRLELTHDGRRLDASVRRILADVEMAKSKVAAVRNLEAGRVDIVTYSAFSLDPLVSLVRRFRLRHPRIVVNIIDADGPAGVHTALRRGDAEVGVTDLSVEHAGMTTIALAEQELVLAMDTALAADLPDPVPTATLRDVPLILDLGDRSTFARIGQLLGEDAGNIVVDCADPSAIWGLVQRGVGATIVPRRVAAGSMVRVLTRSLEPPLTRPIGLALRAGEPSPAAVAFVTVATDRQRGD
ncbi:LysR family transcriptional regulator [Tomitella biformata]|uniref:LysR family transcriptional regulator n=1 Tax=Tomitella biformata TaxID=630403 RepID=UPI000465FA1C|nr:LysR family transcriptional regulator [Tomitella biformata]